MTTKVTVAFARFFYSIKLTHLKAFRLREDINGLTNKKAPKNYQVW